MFFVRAAQFLAEMFVGVAGVVGGSFVLRGCLLAGRAWSQPGTFSSCAYSRTAMQNCTNRPLLAAALAYGSG
jgi:hypothetical protein